MRIGLESYLRSLCERARLGGLPVRADNASRHHNGKCKPVTQWRN